MLSYAYTNAQGQLVYEACSVQLGSGLWPCRAQAQHGSIVLIPTLYIPTGTLFVSGLRDDAACNIRLGPWPRLDSVDGSHRTVPKANGHVVAPWQ